MHTSMRSANRRLVVLEDDLMLLRLLTELLESEGYQVYAHTRAEDAHVLIRNVRPAVVLLDLCLADESGVEESGWRVLDRLVLDPETRHIPVLLTSGAIASIEAHRAALLPQHGVRVLLKPYDQDQLLSALAELLEAIESPRPVQRQESWPPSTDRLTPRQRDIARLIARGCTNGEIAAQLVLEPGTVANHVAHILDRLGVANRAQVAAWAATQGLLDGATAAGHAHVA